jgi:hypothetical protein
MTHCFGNAQEVPQPRDSMFEVALARGLYQRERTAAFVRRLR